MGRRIEIKPERKVFISFLGNSRYDETTYEFEGYSPVKTRFVQEALFDNICANWEKESADNKIIIVCTDGDEGSYKTNYSIDYNPNGLEAILRNKTYTNIVSRCIYKEDVNDIWKWFDFLKSIIPNDVQVYFDVTYAFRSIPIFSLAFFDYIKVIKHASLEHIFYGQYVKDAKPSKIVDLTDVVKLQRYTKVVDAFTTYGHISAFSAEIKNDDDSLYSVSRKIREFDEFIAANRMDDIRGGKFCDIVDKRKDVSYSKLKKPMQEVLDMLLSQFESYTKNSEENVFHAIEWAYKYKMLPQAYTMGYEHIITRVHSLLKEVMPVTLSEKEQRELVSSVIGMKEKDVLNRKFEGIAAKFPFKTCFILSTQWIKELRKPFKDFCNDRIRMDHAKDEGYSYDTLSKNFNKNFYTCISILNSATPIVEPSIPDRNIFVNITNHPSSQWDDYQKETARQYGEVHDLEFPSIDEMGDENYISKLVDKSIADIQLLSNNWSCHVTVHIMGEMTFTYAMVQKLRMMGVTCVASTTERIVDIQPDGSKVVKFKFERFREYR